MRLPVLLAIVGGCVVAVGVALMSLPVGLIVAGVELVAAAYVIGYVEARRGETS